MTGYQKIKEMAKEKGCNIPDLLVLAAKNDPYYSGSKANREKAEWFAELWQRFGFSKGVHLRRVHYRFVSQENPQKHDGKSYKNTEQDWSYLCEAGKQARYLGYIDPGAFVDRRNPAPHVYSEVELNCSPAWDISFNEWWLPSIETDLALDLDWRLPRFSLHGYEYSEAIQPYHIEIWVEKSTMNDILEPLCQRYAVNLVTGEGFMSITAVDALIKRVEKAEKPCRILYISDFDPAGDGMPVAVARQIQFWLNENNSESEIYLEPIMLTREQVEHYNLPRIPIKESDMRRASFEEKYGSGAVELDALEALYEGELARIVEEYIQQFRDENLKRACRDARQKASHKLDQARQEHLSPYAERLEELEEQTRDILQSYENRLEEMQQELEQDLAPIQQEVNSLRLAVKEKVNNLNIELPGMPGPAINSQKNGWLYVSSRNYFQQLEYFKAKKDGKDPATESGCA